MDIKMTRDKDNTIILRATDFYTTKSAAKELGISRMTLWRWVKAGKVIPIKYNNQRLFHISELERLRRKQQVSGKVSKDKRPRPLSEKDFATQVEDLLTRFGWLFSHTYEQTHYARRSTKGFPDYVACRANDDGTARLLFAEIKAEAGVITPEQGEWLELLSACLGVEVYTWRPSGIETIAAILK